MDQMSARSWSTAEAADEPPSSVYIAGDLEPPYDREPPCDVTQDTVSGGKEELCFEGTLQMQTETLIVAPIFPFIALKIL